MLLPVVEVEVLDILAAVGPTPKTTDDDDNNVGNVFTEEVVVDGAC